MNDDRLYLSYAQIHETVQHTAAEIVASTFEPEVMVAIGTGGFIPARILKTYVDRPIFTVAVSYYGMDNVPKDKPETIQWVDEVEKKLSGKRILLVDEVDDTRVTLEYTLTELLRHDPAEIGVMVLHNKRKEKKGHFPEGIQHYFVGHHLEDRWIVYPWDAEDIREHQRQAEGAAAPSRS